MNLNAILLLYLKVNKKKQPLVDINLTGYHTPYCKYTEVNKGGTLLYVNKELNYKPRIYLFIEIINQKESRYNW